MLCGTLDTVRAHAHEALLTDARGDTALSIAARMGRMKAVEIILPASLSCVNQPNGFGDTPLSQAVKHGQWKTIDMLLAAGAELPPGTGMHGNMNGMSFVIPLGT